MIQHGWMVFALSLWLHSTLGSFITRLPATIRSPHVLCSHLGAWNMLCRIDGLPPRFMAYFHYTVCYDSYNFCLRSATTHSFWCSSSQLAAVIYFWPQFFFRYRQTLTTWWGTVYCENSLVWSTVCGPWKVLWYPQCFDKKIRFNEIPTEKCIQFQFETVAYSIGFV